MAEPGNTDQSDIKSKLVSEREVQILGCGCPTLLGKGISPNDNPGYRQGSGCL